MKAAVVNGPAQKPQYTNFPEPVAQEGEERISVRAAALSHFTKSRASGTHYSADGMFPVVAGADGVGTTLAQQKTDAESILSCPRCQME